MRGITALNNNVSLLFVGHDYFTRFTRLAVAYFTRERYPVRMYHASHTNPLGNPNVVDILMSQYLKDPVDDGYNYLGKDLYIARMIRVLKMIPTKYIWYIMPDHFYTTLPPWRVIELDYLPCMDHWSLDQLKLHPLASFPPENNNSELYNRHGIIIKYAGGCGYPLSHHATIYRKEWLLESLRETRAAGGWSNQTHELHYLYHKAHQVKKVIGDDGIIRAAYVADAEHSVELVSAIRLGKLTRDGKEFLEKCEFVEALSLKGINEGEVV